MEWTMATTVEAAFSDENERDAESESSKPTGTLLAVCKYNKTQQDTIVKKYIVYIIYFIK